MSQFAVFWRDNSFFLRTGAGIALQRAAPEPARGGNHHCGRGGEMEHEPAGLFERAHQDARRDVCHNDDRNDPTEHDLEQPAEDGIRVRA